MATPDVFLGETEIFNATDSEKPLGVCSPGLKPGLSPVNGLLVEFAISFILVLVCCGVWDKRNSDKHDSAPIRFGFTITALAMAAVIISTPASGLSYTANLIHFLRVHTLELT